ncbi:hypothetical protein CLAIMM_12600, partial [Cladophialophora immunda]
RAQNSPLHDKPDESIWTVRGVPRPIPRPLELLSCHAGWPPRAELCLHQEISQKSLLRPRIEAISDCKMSAVQYTLLWGENLHNATAMHATRLAGGVCGFD